MSQPRYVRDVECPYCHQPPGQPCRASDRTKRGEHAITFHHVLREKRFDRERHREFGDTKRR